MSIIVYGLTRCNFQDASIMAEYFCCTHIVDCNAEQEEFDPYPLSKKQIEEFKAGSILFLTTIDPDINGYHDHYNRVFPYHLAAHAAGITNADQPFSVIGAETSGSTVSEAN